MKTSRRISRTLTVTLFWVVASLAFAGPAPWYKWRSLVTNEAVCAQTSPGEGWAREPQPYVDARCQRKGIPSGALQ